MRIVQRDWENPVRAEWVENLEEAIAEFGSDVVLVAFWAGQSGAARKDT